MKMSGRKADGTVQLGFMSRPSIDGSNFPAPTTTRFGMRLDSQAEALHRLE